jgi:hypothetical protein
VKTRTEENLDVLVGQLENSMPQQFSDKHIDRYFDGQERLYEYIREDHKDEKDLIKHGRKFGLAYLAVGGSVLVVFVLVIGLFDKKLLGEFLQLFFAFIGGTGVGSILTSKFGKKDE